LSDREIHTESNNVFEANTVVYSTAILYWRKRSSLQPSEVSPEHRKIERVGPIDAVISKAINETLFASLREFIKRILVMMPIIRYHLANLMSIN
jgi:hypothetical protein